MILMVYGHEEKLSPIFFVKYEDFWGGKIIIIVTHEKSNDHNKICLAMYNRKNNGYVVIDYPGSAKISERCGKEVKAVINNGIAKPSNLLLPGFYALYNNVAFYLGSC